MTIEREDGVIRFKCDGARCHRNYESDEDFQGAWAEARAHGWVNAVHTGVWTHFCADCKRELGDD